MCLTQQEGSQSTPRTNAASLSLQKSVHFIVCAESIGGFFRDIDRNQVPEHGKAACDYVHLQDSADTIDFHEPWLQTGILGQPVSALTAYNTDLVVVKADIGTLLAFAAWLPLSVDENRNRARRISVSFNVMFPDFAERPAPPLYGMPDPLQVEGSSSS